VIETASIVKKDGYSGLCILGKTDKRLGHAALKDKDLGFMSAKGTGESDAPVVCPSVCLWCNGIERMV